MQVTARAALSGVLLCSLGAILVLAWMERSLFAFDTWSRLVTDLQLLQRQWHQDMAGALGAVHEQGPMAAWSLASLSFVYGIVHAAGPGHGKMVISTYVLTQESLMRRGILLSVTSSIMQGMTAILAVEATVDLLGSPLRQAQRLGTDLETVSYALIALVGATLVFASGRRAWAQRRNRGEGHYHHGPSPCDLGTPVSRQSLIGMVVSIGVRPCTGAMLVLLVAYALRLRWAGIGAVFAMSLGTAIALSVLALLCVHARTWMLKVAAAMPPRAGRLELVIGAIGMVGGLLVFAFGASLLQAALAAPQHPLF
jgi:ABC-type nickel/cobalt efflux system permease component RcnA